MRGIVGNVGLSFHSVVQDRGVIPMDSRQQLLATEFEDADVAESYRYRAPYPDALHARLLDLAVGNDRLVDLGCGPGKLARPLASAFEAVDAIDPSNAMLQEGQRLDAGRHPHIRWIRQSAEEAPLAGPYALAVAGASIHWMRHERLMPRLAGALRKGAVLALVSGDGPAEADWLDDYRAVIVRWIEKDGRQWEDAPHRELMTAHEPWFETQGRETFQAEVRQPVEDFIAGEHSRATWARARMGPLNGDAFDRELRDVLDPVARSGVLSYAVRTTLTWGQPLRAPTEIE